MLLSILVLLATASLGSIAYRTSRTIVEQAAIREVGVTATVRKQILLSVLTQQRDRAGALLKTADIGCLHSETWCLRTLLLDFVATEGATAARLVYRERGPVMAGKEASLLPTGPLQDAGQIAHFEFDRKGRPSYLIQVRSQDGNATLTIRGDMQLANQIFLDRYGLGQSGETFLTDQRGYFLTPPKYPGQTGESRPIGGKPMLACLEGMDGEVLGEGYRSVAVIHGFRSVPEIGGGCIMALIDQTEAFAPTKRVAKDVAEVSGILAMMAIVCSLLLAQLVSRPMKRLTGRARSLQRGDFDSPVPVEGPSEVRMFAQTFQAMALSLKTSRAALEEYSEQTRNILESISDGFAAFDRQWRCTYVNDKATELSRISRYEILGRNVWDLFPGSASTSLYAELHRAMEEGVFVHFEERYVPFDLWFEIDAYPTKDGLAIFGRDVTERRRFNDRLQQTQKLESLGVLAGGIAHDFNNLLTGIMGNASIVLDDLPPETPVRENLEAVMKASERAAALTRQLLAYAGKGRFVIEPLNLSELAGEITSLLQTSIPRTVELRLQLQDDLPSIEGDAAQIQQLVMNLVINAAEAVEEGQTETVWIITRLEQISQAYINQMIAPNGTVPGTYVTLEVRDAGCGMDAATLQRIFDPFFTTKFTGRGLGLAAVMGMVRGHKGALHVESTPGKGSSFKVLFPVIGGPASSIAPSTPEMSLAGDESILVVDDEDTVRQTAKSALESYGYKVVVAANGKEGVRLFEELAGEIDAVVLDMTMPVMSGEEALARLKSIRPDIPVVLSSGYEEADATRRFTGKGLAGFIQKPYAAAGLAEKIKIALESPTAARCRARGADSSR
ncbi:MAG TPA: response regulator [Terriglobales bacterium]|nr:response regulator [Terriglobales bacterium]